MLFPLPSYLFPLPSYLFPLIFSLIPLNLFFTLHSYLLTFKKYEIIRRISAL